MKPIIAKNKGIEQVEAHMLNMPQVDCPVQHFFGPGIYIRQVTLPAGIIAIGHAQKFEQLNIMLTGEVALIDNGEVKLLKAPKVFMGPPGKKIGYIKETTVWLNVYATDETDIEKLEDLLFEKSDSFKQAESSKEELQKEDTVRDREDFFKLINDYGFDLNEVHKQVINEEDQVPLPDPWTPFITIRKSNIHGKGVFLSYPVEAETIIAPARLADKRTPVGRFTNHSYKPNCEFIKDEYGDIYIKALKPISGCLGGSQGEELTVNYRQALALSGIMEELCQQ
jgi:hypothetical protein